MSNLPKEWQPQPRYELHLAWLTQNGAEKAAPETPEESGHPGWWTRYKINSHHDSIKLHLEAALKEAKDRLLKEKFDQDSRVGSGKAPVTIPPQNREALVERFLASKRLEVGEDELMYELFEPFGADALLVQIFYSPLLEEFRSSFGEERNPIRSLEGMVCRLVDNEGSIEHPEVIAEGRLHIVGNRLTVGFWSQEFDPELEVGGVTTQEAWWYTDEMDYYLFTTAANNKENQ